MATEIPDPKQPGEPSEPTVPPKPDRTTPVPSSQTAPIETLYAAESAPGSQRPKSVAGAPETPADRDRAVAASESAPAASATEAPNAAVAGGAPPVGAGGARWWERRRWSGQRWSGRRTAAVAALAFVLGGAGAAAVAAALPDGGRSASVGDRTTGVGGQLPGGQFPGAPRDHADHDGDDDGGRGGRDFRGGQPPQGGLSGGQRDANGGADSDI